MILGPKGFYGGWVASDRAVITAAEQSARHELKEIGRRMPSNGEAMRLQLAVQQLDFVIRSLRAAAERGDA